MIPAAGSQIQIGETEAALSRLVDQAEFIVPRHTLPESVAGATKANCGVGADTHEEGMTERHLAGNADQDVEAQRRDE